MDGLGGASTAQQEMVVEDKHREMHKRVANPVARGRDGALQARPMLPLQHFVLFVIIPSSAISHGNVARGHMELNKKREDDIVTQQELEMR
jgi:hypothetical protein